MSAAEKKPLRAPTSAAWVCPLQPEREALKASEDIGDRVCGQLADAWPLGPALTLEGMSEADWKRWLQDADNKARYDRAKRLHRLLIEGHIRAMATGVAYRRAQLPALRFVQRGLDSETLPSSKVSPRDRGRSPSDIVDHGELPAALPELPLDRAGFEQLRGDAWPDDDDDNDE